MARAELAPKKPLKRLADAVTGLVERRNRIVERYGNEIVRSFTNVLPSTVTILTIGEVVDPQSGERGQQIGVGAGWMIAPGVIATNAHVVENALHGGRMIIETSGMVNGVQQEDAKRQLEIDESQIYVSQNGHDVAFVPVDVSQFPGLTLPPLRLGKAADLPAGKPLMAVGAPKALEDSLSINTVGHNGTRELTVEGRTDKYIQLGGQINPGNSGGGVFDHSYRRPHVVGMVTLGADGDPTTGFMLPIETIQEEFALFQTKMQIGRRSSSKVS